MYLSNRLTFSLFSVLLVAAFVIVPTAMAQTTVTAYQEITDATATAGEIIVLTLTYSDNPDPRPGIGDFTAADDAITQPDTTDGMRDVLTAAYNDGTNDITVAIGGSGKTVTLKFTGPAGDGTNNGPDIALPAALRLKGYGTGATPQNLNDVANRTTTADATPTTLTISDGYIGGKSYVVYVRHGDDPTSATDAAYPAPVLPSSLTGTNGLTVSGTTAAVVANSQLVRTIRAGDSTAENNNSNMVMPDLEHFFKVGGGTIDLVVEGVGDREVVINEIMWGLDSSKVGQEGHTSQQWIEVHNRKTTPAPRPTFTFIDDTFPAPTKGANVVDRISNIAGYQNVWRDKDGNAIIGGSSGTATRTNDVIIGANPPFASLYRSGYDIGEKADQWRASTRAYFPGFYGTPGSVNTRGGLPATRPDPTVKDDAGNFPGIYTPPKNKIIINEVGNYANDGQPGGSNDWLELRNVSDADVNIENWRLYRTTGNQDDGTDQADEHLIIQFPKVTIPAGQVLLFVNKEPSAHPDLAAGFDITVAAANQQKGAADYRYLNVKARHNKTVNIPNMDGRGLLILRSHHDPKFRGGRGHLHDAAGPSRVTKDTLTVTVEIKEPETGYFWNTLAWPINGHVGDNYRAHNADKADNNNASLDPNADFGNGTVWARSGTKHGWRKGGGGHASYVGSASYKRGSTAAGTPGYHNDVVKNVVANLGGGKLVISELMLTTDDGHYPQWIELHNTSKTHGINTADPDGDGAKKPWKIRFENHNSGKWRTAADDKTVVEFNLIDLFQYIPPNQTVLIVADIARHSRTPGDKTHFPDHRVASILDIKQDDFLIANRRADPAFLNAEGGFYIKILDANGVVSDEIGNLDGKKAEVRNDVPYDDAFGWNWPTEMTVGDRGGMVRTSLIRLKNADGTYRAGTPIRPVEDDPETDADETVEANETRGAVVPLGTPGNMFPMDAAWVHAADTKAGSSSPTYYGSATDQGTPGHTANTPLPVELSFFRPTLEDGQVTIQWTTESELDNAGFNILRSDTRNGEFRQVNEQMIQGKGTTAERSSYKWVDTTAKPGAVYYYQIEDVSFAGEHTKLATTKLKGLISAKGKLTTSWGDIKDASQ